MQEAEKYSAKDEANKHKIRAGNGLESYCFTMRNTLSKEKRKDKFEGGDKEKIKAVQEALDWLDKNQLAEKDEFETEGAGCHFEPHAGVPSCRWWWHAARWYARWWHGQRSGRQQPPNC